MRIVTLLPSATEIVCALGRESQLVGVSHSCDYPTTVRSLPTVTSTRVPYDQSSGEIDSFVRDHLAQHDALYDLDVDRLRSLRPDVIVSQTLCDVCAVATGDVVEALESLPSKPTLVDLQPNVLEDVFQDIARVGDILDAAPRAEKLVRDLRRRCDRVAAVEVPGRVRVAFLEWLDPPFNGGHWNPELVELAGGVDLLGVPGQPSTTQDWSNIAALDPDILFVACCGFGIERARQDVAQLEDHAIWRSLRAVREGRVIIADGNAYFSCPSPRLVDGLEFMAHAFHPDHHPLPGASVPVR